MSHTPAPWLVSTAEGMDNGCVVMGANDRMICEAFEDGETQTDEDQANARLIAAAPDLLSALISLEQAYINKHSPQHRAACLAEARGVIAKATGAV